MGKTVINLALKDENKIEFTVDSCGGGARNWWALVDELSDTLENTAFKKSVELEMPQGDRPMGTGAPRVLPTKPALKAYRRYRRNKDVSAAVKNAELEFVGSMEVQRLLKKSAAKRAKKKMKKAKKAQANKLKNSGVAS